MGQWIDQAAGVAGGGGDSAAPVQPAGLEWRERGEADGLVVAGQERNGVESHLATEERTPMRLATNNQNNYYVNLKIRPLSYVSSP